jgi:small-conductance mechanosensitive channel
MTDMTEPTKPVAPLPEPEGHLSSASLVVAGIWAAVAVILAIVLLAAAKDESYGGDAYTGIQNAVMLAVRGIAFLLLGSAALGFVIATRQDRRW